jgi:hypothetical protein
VNGFRKARFGSPHDGGYVLIDDFEGIDTAFSFGIAQDCSWDVDVADRDITIYQYDPSIDSPPVTDNPRLIFTKKKISSRDANDSDSLSSLVARHDKRLSRPNILVKMDIENSEWLLFDETPSDVLSRFSQMVVEFHLRNHPLNSYWRDIYARVFQKLSDLYAVVHVHGNNFGKFINVGNVMLPKSFEVTFANRNMYSFVESNELFPGPLDAPNNPTYPDMYLGNFRF